MQWPRQRVVLVLLVVLLCGAQFLEVSRLSDGANFLQGSACTCQTEAQSVEILNNKAVIENVPGLESDPVIHFRTYGDKSYTAARKRIVQEANATGWFHSVIGYGPKKLPENFTSIYSDILSQKRGGGYWIWKIPILQEAMDLAEEGDFVVYADAGCKINGDGEERFKDYLDMIRKSHYDVLSFEIPHPEYMWTTENIFQAFEVDSKNASIRETNQLMATVLVMQKGAHSRKFLRLVSEVLRSDPFLFTDKYNDEARRANDQFKDNRHDQSILSVARKVLGSVVLKTEAYPPGMFGMPFWASRQQKGR